MISLVSLLRHLGKGAVYNLYNNMIKETKYCSDVIEKNFNKELFMTKEDNKSFQASTKCWNCDNDYIYNDDKVGDHCHITGK